jgi:hypothetical protein
MYKLAEPSGIKVHNLDTGEQWIHPGLYQWREYKAWLAKGNTPLPFETAEEKAEREAQEAQTLQQLQDRVDVKGYAKLQALSNMSPAQVRAWVDANVNSIADAKDAIKTLAVAVSILARNL